MGIQPRSRLIVASCPLSPFKVNSYSPLNILRSSSSIIQPRSDSPTLFRASSKNVYSSFSNISEVLDINSSHTMSTYNYKYFNVTFPKDGVAVVEINRPEVLNSFVKEMWINYRDIMNQLADDPNCRSVILTGAGDKAFTAGLDIKKADIIGDANPQDNKLDSARKMREIRQHMMEFQECVGAPEKSLKPTISVLHGYAFGLAIDLASATDIRFCTSDVKLSVREVDIGLAADVGTLSRLPKIVGSMSWVKEICFSARIWGAEEALKMGFVSGVFNDKKAALEGAMKLAESIAAKSPVAVQGTKEIINFSVDHTVETGLRYTAAWNSGALQTDDVAAAVKGSLTRTKPSFAKL